MAATLYCAVVIFACCLLPVELASLKIHISPRPPAIERRFLRQDTTACEDRQRVERSSLQLTGVLDTLDQRVQFYTSNSAREGITSFLATSAVTGIEPVTAAMVVEALRTGGCPVYVFGGIVRDQFLGAPSNDVDAEVDCNVTTIVAICRTEWGREVCGEESDDITHIGTVGDPSAVDLKPTTSTFYASNSLVNLEYTANSLAYDLNGRNAILDLPGTGVRDVCNRHIRIPSDDDSLESWNNWRNGSTPKLYRYWKLRAKGFTAIDSATGNYIVSNARRSLDMGTEGFKALYCKNVYQESHFASDDNTCRATAENCKAGISKAVAYNTVLREDFGATYVQDTVRLPTCSGESGHGFWEVEQQHTVDQGVIQGGFSGGGKIGRALSHAHFSRLTF